MLNGKLFRVSFLALVATAAVALVDVASQGAGAAGGQFPQGALLGHGQMPAFFRAAFI